MHELSVAAALIEIVELAAREAGAEHVSRVRVRIGPLAGVDAEALLFAYGVATEGTMLQGSTLDVDSVPVVVGCDYCGAETTLTDYAPFVCATCGLPASDVRQGRELDIVDMDIEVHDAAATD